MEKQETFEVFVSGLSSTPEEWRRALSAPTEELPELNPEQKEAVRRFGITEEEYQRGYLAGLYGRERLRERGVELGRAVKKILAGLGEEYQLRAVKTELEKERWVVRIQTPDQIVNVAVDRELANDVIDSDTVQDQERLRHVLLSSLGRSELLGRQ